MDIKIYRNNSGVAEITLKKKSDGTAWNIPVGNELQFSVKKSVTDSDEEIIFFKTGTGDGGNVYNFFITGFDTDIMPGMYKWDLKDKTANLTLDKGDFKILENVYHGQTVTGEENELTEIEAFVELDGIYTETNYNNLNNRPKINNVTLEDNKTGSDLGLADLTVTDGLNSRLTEAEVDITVFDIAIDNLETTKADKTELPENLSDLTNDAGFIAESVINSKDLETLASAKSYADTKDTATLNSAKAYTDSAVGGETLELIAQGSADTVSSFSISQDTNGNAFNLKEFYLKFENFICPGATSDSHKNGSMFLHNAKNPNRLNIISFYYNADTTKNRTYSFYLKKVSGYWVALNMSTVYNTGASFQDYGGCTPLTTDCDSINFEFFSGSYSFDYKLYGVRV